MKFAPSPQATKRSTGRGGDAKRGAGRNGVALAPPASGNSTADHPPVSASTGAVDLALQPGHEQAGALAPAAAVPYKPPPLPLAHAPLPTRLPQPAMMQPAKLLGVGQKSTGVATGAVQPATPAVEKVTPTQSPRAAQTLSKHTQPMSTTAATETAVVSPPSVGALREPAQSSPLAEEGPVGRPPTAAPITPSGEAQVADTVASPVEPPPSAAIAATSAVELLMPEPPVGLTPKERTKLDHTRKRVNQTAAIEASVPSAEANTASARNAVTEPAAELQARSQNALIATLDEQPTPSPQIRELCQQIRAIIAAKRPPDEKSFLTSDFAKIAKSAGKTLNQSVETQAAQVEGQYAPLGGKPPGAAPGQPQAISAPPNEVATPDIGAAAAAPAPLPAENLSLQADVAASQQRINAAGMNTEVAQQIQTGPVAEARAGQAELQQNAATAEAAMVARQDAAIANAQSNMGKLQTQALQMLVASRRTAIQRTGRQQTTMMGQEEAMREKIGSQAQAIFTNAQRQVNTLLKPLRDNAMARWNTGVDQLSQQFKAKLARVDEWKKERYEGILGGVLEFFEGLFDPPAWITAQLDQAEKEFGDGVCQLLTEISLEVNTIIATCEKLIANARRDIDQLFQENLPKGLELWAENQRALFQEKLDGLQARVAATRDTINDGLVQEAAQAVQAVREEIHKRREEAKGLLQKIGEAIAAFVENPGQAIINGLLSLANIAPAAFWAVVDRVGQVISDIANDPLGFADKLLSAIGKGFAQFFENFGKHILSGFWEWLFSGLGALGIELPRDLSLKGIVTFILQLLGISWARIRKLLAKHIGEKNIALIEKAWGVVARLIEKGPEGIFELLKEQLNPKAFIDQLLSAAVDYLVSALIKQVTVRVALLFNPVGAIVQAVMAIYKVLKWIFTNAARIFSLIETVVNGMAALIAGDIGGMATAVEKALVRLIAPVISFIADLVGLDDLPAKIAKTIQGFQGWIEGILDRVIEWLAEQGRKLLATVGLGKKEEPGKVDTELGASVTFWSKGEQHRQWIEIQGTDARLMVASATPEEVKIKLAQWEAKLGTQFAGNEAGRNEAEGLIASARTLLGQADTEADALATAFQRANAARGTGVPEIPNDDSLESKQQALGVILGQLFRIFGGNPEQKLKEIADALPNHTGQFTEKVHRSWYDNQISKVKVGNEKDSPKLWDSSILNNTETLALAYVRERPLHQRLLPYFSIGDRERKADTAAFYDYVFINRNVEHGARTSVLNRLGGSAENQLKSSGNQVDAVPDVGDDYKTKLKQKLLEITYGAGEGDYGRFNLPTERIPDHSRHKPASIRTFEEYGRRFIEYVTIAGKEFQIVEDLKTGLSKTVHGVGLTFRAEHGRGVTQDSPGFQTNMQFNRAHLIADEFSGSGYKAAANLATTSDYYNQRIMRDAELSVGQSVEDFAVANSISTTAILIDMTVEVTFGDLINSHIVNLIKSQDWVPDSADVKTEIENKVNASLTSPLKRVIEVQYLWRIYVPSRSGVQPKHRKVKIGPDLWLLIDYRLPKE